MYQKLRTSPGRPRAFDPHGIRALLIAYFSEENPTTWDLALDFMCSEPTVRRYLRLALGENISEGHKADAPLSEKEVNSLYNRISTSVLLGNGCVKRLCLDRSCGASVASLAETYGISAYRVSKLLKMQEAINRISL